MKTFSLTTPFLLFLAAILVGFFVGGIPFGYLIPKIFKNLDIRLYGSKNIGFTNVYRTLGPVYALPVLILDFAKGFLPVFFAPKVGYDSSFIGIGAIFGHLFSPYLGFKGGKGVATTFGVLLGLAPKNFLLSLAIWLLVLLLSSYVSLASISFAFSLPLSFFLFKNPEIKNQIFFFLVSLLIILKHIPNIRRLLLGKEDKFKFRIPK